MASLALAGCHGGTRHPSPTSATQSKATIEATSQCLAGKGAVVGPVTPDDSELRSLRDSAQHTSRQVRLRGLSAAIAVGNSPDPQLLSELLTVPGSGYRISVRGNALVLYQQAAAAIVPTVFACLH